jgi:hypothetical protein
VAAHVGWQVRAIAPNAGSLSAERYFPCNQTKPVPIMVCLPTGTQRERQRETHAHTKRERETNAHAHTHTHTDTRTYIHRNILKHIPTYTPIYAQAKRGAPPCAAA